MSQSRKYVIFDTDGGADDAWGLVLLLKADQLQRIKLLAVTCGHGNARKQIGQSAINIYRILRATGRLDIPIYWGAETELIPPTTLEGIDWYHGLDGLGDVFTDVIDYTTVIQTQHAVEAMYDLVNRYPREVTIIAVGPQTNLALAMTMYGEQWYKKIKQLYIMGGNYKAIGNSTSAAEFNFYLDPEAAHIVLKKAKFPVTILPWEACLPPYFEISVDWRFSVLGVVSAAVVTLLNTVETAELIPKGYTTWVPCDAILVSVFLFGDQIIEKESKWNAVVDVNGWLTRGQMVIDHLHKHHNNIRLIEMAKAEVFKTVALWAVGSGTIRSAFLQNPKCE